jgi:SAM-dependent methyltransferase
MSSHHFNVPSSTLSAEQQRIREVFGQRTEAGAGPFDLYGLCTHQERQESLVRFFRGIGLTSLRGLKMLDVGCGSGGQLRRLIDFGAEPENCFGIDLFRKSLVGGRRLNPDILLVEGSGAQLPFRANEFDLVFQFTVLTSVLDPQLRRSITDEICRVLRPGGYFIWYDFAYSNPKNPNVRGIGRSEISELLAGFSLSFRRVTLAPPIGRRAVQFSPLLYRALNCIPLLRSHYFCFAQKPAPV